MNSRHYPLEIHRLLFGLVVGAFLACLSAHGDITMEPAAGLARRIVMQRGEVRVQFQNSWNSFMAVTRSGRGLFLVDPVLYGLSPVGKKHLRWADFGWARLKWRALEQNKTRDVLYVEGDYEGWRVQAWIALYGQEEAIYVRRRTMRIRARPAGVSAWGTLGASYGEGDVEKGRLSVIIDGAKLDKETSNIKDYLVFQWADKSAALLNPGEKLQRRGERARHFARLIHHKKNRFMEALLSQDSARVTAADYLETNFVLLWGDGDIGGRVKSALADRASLAARLPEPVRPDEVANPEPIELPRPAANLPNALVRASFHTPKGIRRRVYPAGKPVGKPPTIDGKLDDAAWRKPWTGEFIARNTSDVLADVETSFQCAYTADALYLALRCSQPNLSRIRKARHRPQKWSSGEQVEMFFLAGEKVFQICADPDGGVCDLVDNNIKADLKLNLKTGTDEKGWAYEIEIPFAELGIKPPEPFDTMGFNLVRNAGVIGGPMDCSAWNAARGAFAGVQNFGTIFFGEDADFRRLNAWHVDMMLDRDVYDTLHASAGLWLDITASGELPDDAKIFAGILDAGDKLVRASEIEARGKRGSLILNLQDLPAGKYRCRIGLTVGDKPVAETASAFAIQPAKLTPKRRGSVPISVQSAHGAQRLPVSLGVPFPRGALTDAGQVRLLDAKGGELPIQTSALARWDPAGSISWLRVHFQALKASATASRYVLEYGAPSRARPQQSIRITELEDVYVVDTGPLRFGVPREQGGVISSVFLDTNGNGSFEPTEQLIVESEAIGPYLVDRNSKLYRASLDRKARVQIEQQGPLRAVFRIESWYVAQDGAKLCKHVTRASAFAGLPHLRLEHTWIMTAASGEAAFKDIGFTLPTVKTREVVFGTEDGPFHLYNRFPRYLIQSTEKHYEVQAAYQRLFVSDAKERHPIRWRAMVEGAHAPGWMALRGERGGMALAVDEFWQNFPKELGIDGNEATFHSWPRHGRPRNRPLSDDTVSKLDFVHGGEVLDFTVPKEMADYKPVNSYEQRFINGAVASNAIGAAKTHRFAVTFFPPSATTAQVQSEVSAVADSPHALASSEWMAATGVFGPMHHRDPKGFPEIENAFDLWSRIVPRLNRIGSWYGMWLYGQLHTTYNVPAERWDIYRVFNQMHHSGPRWPWLMWVRSGQKDLMDFALANTRIVADVGFCHHSRPEFEKLGWPKGKIRGALTDYKGLVPWHSGSRNPDYNSMTAFLMWHYYFTGDGWTRDVANMWGELAKRQGPTGGSRTGAGTVRANLDLYRATWDTDLIPIYRKTADALLASQFPDGSFPEWENYAMWIGDYFQFTGQENSRTALVRWADAHLQGHGDVSEIWGNAMNLIAQAWFVTGDLRYARAARGHLESWCRSVNDNPASHLRGMHGGRDGRSLSFVGFHLPRSLLAQKAWLDAGADISPIYPRTHYGWSPKCTDGIHRIEVPILDDDDSPIEVRVDGYLHSRERDPQKEYELKVLLLGPDGKPVRDDSFTTSQRTWDAHGRLRIAPRPWQKFRVPKDGRKGVYRLIVESKSIEFGLTLPVSNRKEVVALNLDAQGRLLLNDHASLSSFYLPEGTKRPALRLSCSASSPQTVQLRDPQFRVIQKFYLNGLWPQSQRRSTIIGLPANYRGGFWTVSAGVAHAIWIEFTGDWKPEYYAVEPSRGFRLEEFNSPVRLKP
jgi:hypothetical protein